jgi:hypothetical protein
VNFDSDYYLLKTKEMIDYALGKIPGSATRDVQVNISWHAVDSGPDEKSTFQIVPEVSIRWGMTK